MKSDIIILFAVLIISILFLWTKFYVFKMLIIRRRFFRLFVLILLLSTYFFLVPRVVLFLDGHFAQLYAKLMDLIKGKNWSDIFLTALLFLLYVILIFKLWNLQKGESKATVEYPKYFAKGNTSKIFFFLYVDDLKNDIFENIRALNPDDKLGNVILTEELDYWPTIIKFKFYPDYFEYDKEANYQVSP